jgi:acyl-CoA oxidase
LSVRCDITLFLYTKSIFSFCRRGHPPHEDLIHRGLTAKDIGCFGLTEIGHGSNTKDLETEATYDHATRSFILNTPTDTGFKFWIGGAAEIANMALIWAQMIVNGKRYGVHPFAIPIRDRKTMLVLDGVLIADCGAKFGMHGIDNGKIGFRNYRVSYDCLLDRIARVD